MRCDRNETNALPLALAAAVLALVSAAARASRTAADRPTLAIVDVARDLGTIETGRIADLVLLDANPLADIARTRRIAAVVANGRLFDRAALATLLTGADSAAR